MARRKLIWHIGLADPPRPQIAASLEVHRPALGEAGVLVAAGPDEAGRATHELLRTHKRAGLSRDEVEGRWARICDRVWQHKGTSILSTPELCVADKDQIKLALNPLIGIEVHLVVTLDTFSQQIYGGWLAELRAGRTTGWDKYVGRVLTPTREHRQAEQFWAGHDLAAILTRWGWTLRAERVHVVADGEVGVHWRELLRVAGVPADGLDPVVPAYADPAGVAVLRKVNRQVEDRLALGTSGLLTRGAPTDPRAVASSSGPATALSATGSSAAGDHAASAMPVADTGALLPVAEQWVELLAGAGHDLRGDLALLVDQGEGTSLPGPRDQLGVAVDALAEALSENSRLRLLVKDLQADRDRLDRKRRKLKRRLEGSRPRTTDSP